MKKVYKLEDLDCANCAAKMEAKIKTLEGINDANVSFINQKMTIDFAEGVDIEAKMDEVVKVCKKVEPDCIIKR